MAIVQEIQQAPATLHRRTREVVISTPFNGFPRIDAVRERVVVSGGVVTEQRDINSITKFFPDIVGQTVVVGTSHTVKVEDVLAALATLDPLSPVTVAEGSGTISLTAGQVLQAVTQLLTGDVMVEGGKSISSAEAYGVISAFIDSWDVDN